MTASSDTTSALGVHRSYWLREVPAKQQFPKLNHVHKTEVAVLGGGITGLSVALELLQRGHRVTVLEAMTIGAGTSAGSTGHLDAHPEMGPSRLVKMLGVDRARAYTQYRQDAILTIKHNATPACDFKSIPGYYYSEHDTDGESLQTEKQAAEEIGLAVQWVNQLDLPFSAYGYEIKEMGRIHCMHYLKALTKRVTELGGKIFEHSLVSGIMGTHPNSLEVETGRVEFDQVICAVHCNYTDALRIYLQTPPYQSYVVAVNVQNPCPDGLFWDNHHPYFYLRRANSSDPHLILVGGCDHRTGTDDSVLAFARLRQYVKDRFKVNDFVTQWSAELFEPTDGLPIIGKVPGKENVWVATGFSGIGLTWGTAAAKIIADLIVGEHVMLEEELSPARFGTGGLLTMASEQLSTAANYAERIIPAERIDPTQLAIGQGKVGVVDGKFTAACRDKDGCLHLRNPLCAHMKGVVHWNEAEQTWDCPVHGGRYAADGTRLYGPPDTNLTDPGQNAGG